MTDSTKNSIAWTIRAIVGVLFLVSAVAKMYPSPYFAISTFEVKQLYPMGFSEEFAPYFSRILIGIEFALGILIFQNHYLKKFVIPVTFLMLVVFTSHLSIVTFISGGNSGNCGCFGSLLPMTPIEAIIKNVILMALLGYLLYILPKKKETNGNFWILTTVTLASILMIFMLAPIQPIANVVAPEITMPVTDSIPEVIIPAAKIDTTSTAPKTIADPVKEIPKTADAPVKHKSGYAQYFSSIDNGKKVLCFFVPGCEHCKETAKELTEMKKKNKDFPEINIVFMNEEADLIPTFFQFAGAEYPYKVIEIIPFWKVLGANKDTPGVKYLWNGNEYVYYWGITDNKFNADEFEKIVKKPYSELKK